MPIHMTELAGIVCSLLGKDLATLTELVKHWGGTARELSMRPEFKPLRLREIDLAISSGERILRDCRQLGIDILTPLDRFYPFGFLELLQPPLWLSYFGDTELLEKRSLSVVGSRQPLPWIAQWMEKELAAYLSQRHYQVISGGARGIDQLAHRVALQSGSTSIAILPSGIEQLYPAKLQEFAPYFSQNSWGLLAEYPPATTIKRHHFYRRNQLIAAFSQQLFVAQAQIKSGTMMTAQYAVDLGREVYTLPGMPLQSATAGNLQLLFDGALLVRSAGDLPNVKNR